MGSTFTGVPVLALDDNLSNGKTYTFQFQSENYIFNPSNQTLNDDIIASAPDFITSLNVTTPASSATTGETSFFKTLYAVQFTYEGDGSDVVIDVANSIISSAKAVSNDNISFVGGVQSGASSLNVTPSQVASKVEQAASDAANKIAQDAIKASTDAINKALQGLLPLLIVVVLIILFVVPSFVKSTGIRVSAG